MSELNDLLTTRELQRWRLILGEAAETTLCGLDDNARQIDHALEWLYGRDPERLQRGERSGGLGGSNLTTPEWINSIHTLFPQQVIERLESDAVLRYGIEDVVTNLDVLERMQPSESLLRAVLHTKHLMNPEVLAAARQIVRQVVEEIMARLAKEVRHVSFKGESFRFQRPYGSYVMENVLFKISFPAEFHSQTAVEAAMTLYEQMQAAGKTAADIEKVTIRTHEACIRIIDKKGPLNNPADRDHCIQYMVAIPLLFGRLTAADYEDNVAQDKRIDALREKINCFEDPALTADYHDPEKRAIANAITLEFTDGTRFEEVVVEYPIGHARRRQDGIPKLVDKFKINLARQFPTRQQQRILEVSLDRARLEQMPVNEYLDLYVI